jgi:hypothetical protein
MSRKGLPPVKTDPLMDTALHCSRLVLDMLEEERLVRLTIEPTLARVDALLAKKRIKAS